MIYGDIVYLNNYSGDDLRDEIVIESIKFSQPMPIEEFLASEDAASLSPETRREIEEKLEVGKSPNNEAVQFSNSAYTIDVVDFTFEPDEKIDVSIIPAGEMTLKDYVYLFRPEFLAEEGSNSGVSASSQCDLYVNNLYSSSGSQPFAINSPYNFTFTIGNSGPADAAGVTCDVYLDNDYAGALNFGTIPANTSGNVTIAISVGYGGYGGLRTLKINAGTLTPDSSYLNNGISRAFTWKKNVDLVTDDLQNHTSGDTPFEATISQVYSVLVFNYGKDTATSPCAELKVYSNNNLLLTDEFDLPELPERYVSVLSWNQSIYRSGHYTFQVTSKDRIDTVDADPSDNTIAKTFECIPDGCGISSLYTLVGDTTNISLSVIDSRLDVSDVASAAQEWNGITREIHIEIVERDLLNPTCTITVSEASLGNGGYFRPNFLPNYTGGRIVIICDNPDSRHVMVHEIGHLVSLLHPHEDNPLYYDDSSMQYNLSLWKDYVTPHDKRALIKKWGNSY